MILQVAFQMDKIESINADIDSTFLLGIEATRRGYEVFYYTPDKLTYLDGKITARAHRIKFFEAEKCFYELGEEIILDLQEMQVIMLRQDPPFNMEYITTTYLLEMLTPQTLIVNNPASVRNHAEKIFPTMFKNFMPPTLISADEREIEKFYAEHKDIILKPLYGYGGRSVLHLKEGDDNFSSLIEMFFSGSREPIIAQKFLPEVKGEDKRIVLIDGEVAGAFGRIPEEGNIRANMRVGGKPVAVALSAKQREICEVIKPYLKDKGFIFVGLDVIGDYLTEINVTSPTGLRVINRLNDVKLESDIWNAIFTKLYSKPP